MQRLAQETPRCRNCRPDRRCLEQLPRLGFSPITPQAQPQPLFKNGQIQFRSPFIMYACQTPAGIVKSRRLSMPRKAKPFKSKRKCCCLAGKPRPATRRENSCRCLRRLKPTPPATRATSVFHARRSPIGSGSRLRSYGGGTVMGAQTERLAEIAKGLTERWAPGRQITFDGPQASIRIWPDDRTGDTRFQIRGYWPEREIAGRTDDQLRELLNSWPKRSAPVQETP